ncbi:MAG TPA: tetratricopeptide repeat protein [Terracidiphilus sp.]|nr:tetratricopeptide repeat protein [Terracidiphilus sp.]
MSSSACRRWLLTVTLLAFSLTATWAVFAAGESASSAPAGSVSAVSSGHAPDDPLPDPATHIPVTGTTTAFHESVAARYNYAFGRDTPFLPSNASSVNGQFLSPRAFPTAKYCGHCHQQAYKEWRESVHSNSFRQPWYLKNVNTLIGEKGVQYSRHCEGCHNPVALLSGDLSQGMPEKRPFEQEGITCSTCHSIVKTDTTGTGSYVMGIPAVLVDASGNPITGPVSDAEILAHLDRHSRAVMRPFYKTPEFCAVCHKASIPRELDNYKFLRAFTVYDEWQGSSFSRQNPLPFYRKDAVSTCQTCHMKEVPVSTSLSEPGAKNGLFHSHRWTGGNTLNPVYFKYDDQLKAVIDFLQHGPDGKGVIGVDIFGLENESAAATQSDRVLIAPLGLTRFSLAPGETLVADVILQNKGIGHSFIPEQRDFYEAWLNFTVKDSSGKVLAESGFLQPDGYLDPSAHSFTNRLVDNKGNRNYIHQIWHNRVTAYDNTIQSGRSQLVRYRFRLPRNISGAVTLTATVCYRRFNQHFLDYAFGQKHYPEPIVDIASQTRVLNIGVNNPVAPGPDENPEWMRWNNYGISLLDALQYPASVEAFERVATLRPGYADVYTNMAVVQIAWERYKDAGANLAKALALLPGDPRALYYRALVERNAGRNQEAVNDFKAVLARYPRAKDALRELGFSYFQQRRYAEAEGIYQRLQAIDPDNLAAHYALAIIYRRLGDRKKSALESAKYVDQKADPTAGVYALMVLRKHPEVAAESVTWHVHDLTGDPVRRSGKLEYHLPGAGR